MKQRISFATVGLMLSLMLAVAGSASAQHLISSKAGFVNRADGTVYVLRHDSEDGKAGRASLGTSAPSGAGRRAATYPTGRSTSSGSSVVLRELPGS